MIHSKLFSATIFAVSSITVLITIALVHGNQNTMPTLPTSFNQDSNISQVVIIGKRMTMDEKAKYDGELLAREINDAEQNPTFNQILASK